MTEDSGLGWGWAKEVRDAWDKTNRFVAGTEALSALVAKHVMQFDTQTLVNVKPNGKETPYEWYKTKDGLFSVPDYAAGESIWDVVEKCWQEGLQLKLTPLGGEYSVKAEFYRDRVFRSKGWNASANTSSFSAPTAPIAYCIAALWAVGVEVEYRPEQELPRVGEVIRVADKLVDVLMVNQKDETFFPRGVIVVRQQAGEISWLSIDQWFRECELRRRK